ncbi:hypothetical protein LINPERPRIM_LOCUS27915 [Linum perenne]
MFGWEYMKPERDPPTCPLQAFRQQG